MISVEGESNESLVLDGEWFEKQRMGEPKARIAASTFQKVEWKEFEKPPFVGLITEAEKRPRLEEIVAGLEAAAAGAQP